MKRLVILTALSATIILLSQCAPKSPAAKTASTPAAVKTYTEAELEEGKTIWQAKCDKCHKLYLPETRTTAKWENVLPRMIKRSKIEETDAGKVRAYIMAHARKE